MKPAAMHELRQRRHRQTCVPSPPHAAEFQRGRSMCAYVSEPMSMSEVAPQVSVRKQYTGGAPTC